MCIKLFWFWGPVLVSGSVTLDVIIDDMSRRLYVAGFGRTQGQAAEMDTPVELLRIELSESWADIVGLNRSRIGGISRNDQLVVLRGVTNQSAEIMIQRRGHPVFRDMRREMTTENISYLGLSPDSLLTNQYPNFIFFPVPEMEGPVGIRLELAPQHPEEKCIGGRLTYQENAVIYAYPDEDGNHGVEFWGAMLNAQLIPAGIEYAGTNAYSTLPIGNAGSDPVRTAVPRIIETRYGFEILPWDSIVQPLIYMVESTSEARWRAGSGQDTDLQFFNCNNTAIFPSLLYALYEPDMARFIANHKIDIVLLPTDYVTVTESNTCVLDIRSTGEQTFGAISVIGANLLRVTASFFDSENRRIGFCDPL